MADSLFPTKTRLALLRDVEAGKVSDDEDCTPTLDLGDGETSRVASAIWEMRHAGWVVFDQSNTWRLTDAGRAVLDEAGGDPQ